jgi:hypothetical protein
MAPRKRSSKPQELSKQAAAPKPPPKITKARRDAIWRALPGLPGVVFWRQKLLVPLAESTFAPLHKRSDQGRADEISEALRLLVVEGYGELTHIETEVPRRPISCMATNPDFWKWLQDAASLPSLADGPVGDDGFRWESRECHGLRPLAHRLLAFLWHARDHSAVFSDLKELVWGNREARISSDMVGSVRRELNRFFEGNAIPFKVTVKRDRVTLVRLRQ